MAYNPTHSLIHCPVCVYRVPLGCRTVVFGYESSFHHDSGIEQGCVWDADKDNRSTMTVSEIDAFTELKKFL